MTTLAKVQMKNPQGIDNVQQLFDQLRQRPNDVVLTPAEATKVWEVFSRTPMRADQLQDLDYRAFLQAALIGAIDGSSALGWIKVLMTSAYKPNPNLKAIIGKLLIEGLKRYYRHIVGEDPPLYQTVITTIKYYHRTHFEMISAGLDL